MKAKYSVPVLLLALASPSFAQSDSAGMSPPAIVVNGSAQIEVDPDEATVRLGVARQAGDAESAQEQANSAARDILAAIRALGIPDERIQTSRLTLLPVYTNQRPESASTPRVGAYRASNVVSVELSDLTLVGPVIDTGLKAGANQLEGVHFRVRNDAAVRERALRQAVTEARRKAEVIAETLGTRITGILEVNEGGVSILPRGDAYGGVIMARAAEATPTPVSPGQLDVQANVTVRYRIDGE